MLPLPQLSAAYNVPVSYVFRYLQLSPQSTLLVVQSTLEDVLQIEYVERPTSRLYSHLLLVSSPPLNLLLTSPGGSTAYQTWMMIRRIFGTFLFGLWCPYGTDTYNSKLLIELTSLPIDFIRRNPFTRQSVGDAEIPWVISATYSGLVLVFWADVLVAINGVISVPLQPCVCFCVLGLVEHIITAVAQVC